MWHRSFPKKHCSPESKTGIETHRVEPRIDPQAHPTHCRGEYRPSQGLCQGESPFSTVRVRLNFVDPNGFAGRARTPTLHGEPSALVGRRPRTTPFLGGTDRKSEISHPGGRTSPRDLVTHHGTSRASAGHQRTRETILVTRTSLIQKSPEVSFWTGEIPAPFVHKLGVVERVGFLMPPRARRNGPPLPEIDVAGGGFIGEVHAGVHRRIDPAGRDRDLQLVVTIADIGVIHIENHAAKLRLFRAGVRIAHSPSTCPGMTRPKVLS